MNKYVYSECKSDYWPEIKTIMAKSYNDAVERLIIQYGDKLDDDTILNTIETYDDLREHLNDKYNIVLSDLEDYEEI